jgi:hypothetical protein
MIPGWRKNYLKYRSYLLSVVGRYRERADIKAYLEILLSLVTISIFAFFALKPTLLTIAQLLKDIDSKNETLAKMNEKIQSLANAQALYDQERNKIELLRVAIPENPAPDVFLRQLEGLSAKYQTPITALKLGNALILGDETTARQNEESGTALPEGAGQLTFSLNTSTDIANYLSLSNFLTDMENLRRPVKIDSFDFNSSGGIEGKALVLIVSGKVPYLNQEGLVLEK